MSYMHASFVDQRRESS